MRKALILALAGAFPLRAEPLKTIVAVGDSTTAGTPYFQSPVERPPSGRGRADAPYPAAMAKQLPGWKVLNCGVNGETTGQILARLERDVLAPKPRYALVLAGVNDVYQGVPAEGTRKNLGRIYSRIQAAGIVPIAASVLPFNTAGPERWRRLAELNAWIEAEASRRAIPFLDLARTAADAADPRRLKASPDGLHPDIETYRAMGKAAAGLISRLETSRGADTFASHGRLNKRSPRSSR